MNIIVVEQELIVIVAFNGNHFRFKEIQNFKKVRPAPNLLIRHFINKVSFRTPVTVAQVSLTKGVAATPPSLPLIILTPKRRAHVQDCALPMIFCATYDYYYCLFGRVSFVGIEFLWHKMP